MHLFGALKCLFNIKVSYNLQELFSQFVLRFTSPFKNALVNIKLTKMDIAKEPSVNVPYDKNGPKMDRHVQK